MKIPLVYDFTLGVYVEQDMVATESATTLALK